MRLRLLPTALTCRAGVAYVEDAEGRLLFDTPLQLAQAYALKQVTFGEVLANIDHMLTESECGDLEEYSCDSGCVVTEQTYDTVRLLHEIAAGHFTAGGSRRAPPGASPIEVAFAAAWHRLTEGGYPRAQVQIGRYRADFVSGRTVIECDGHASHSSAQQRTHDAQRDRWLQSRGYRVIRFTGSEIHRDADACARQAIELSVC